MVDCTRPSLITDIIRVQESTDSGTSYEEFVDSVAEDILQNIPDRFVIKNVRKIFENNYTPATVVLLQELERFNTLVDKMNVTLQMLRKVGFDRC